MKQNFWTAALFALAPLYASAQSPAAPDAAQPAPRAVRGRQAAELYEDIEILRRLLARRLAASAEGQPVAAWLRLQNFYGRAAAAQQHAYYPYQVLANPYDPYVGVSAQHLPPAEGVYLDGKGVVITVTLPHTGRDPMPTTFPAAAAPVSDWEHARRQLRGEQPAPPAEAEAAQPSAADLIAAVLAENGKRLRLGPDDDVTVVVTMRAPGASSTATTAASGIDTPTGNPEKPNSTPANLVASLYQATRAAVPNNIRDYELLGDLHIRQQQYQQAAETYQKIISLQPQADPKVLAEAFRKLAEAKLQMGRHDEAKAAFESAVEWLKKAQLPSGERTSPASPRADRLPAKLIVTAPKRLLDDVGSGRVTPEQFKKQLRIDYYAF